ncbi:MAG TPA: hypothetical protein VJ912_02620 [Candidatus Nanoarchaeia archaeon]|nr:hypothetical protein [Candidatus Nanoarchaeia archaeon]
MKQNNLLLILAIVAVVVAMANAFIALNKVNSLTGHATEEGYANLTVSSTVNINFSQDTVNWGEGIVDVGEDNATLDTVGPTVTGGNWTTTGVEPLILENIGNVNATINMRAASSAQDFLGGTSPAYEWNFTNNEANSCTQGAGVTLGSYASTSTSNTEVCAPLNYLTGQNSLQIDIRLTVPYNSKIGSLSDTITAEATAA